MNSKKPKRGPPVKVSIWSRWYLPGREQHLAIPVSVLTAVTAQENLSAEEFRALLWLLMDWYWPGGLSREVNAEIIAKRARLWRPNVHRALDSLAEHGILEIHRRGKGKMPVVSIEPLIRLARLVASNGVSGGYSSQGRSAHQPQKEYQFDTPTPVFDTPGSIKREPGDGTSESLSSDPFNAAPVGDRASLSSVERPEKAAEALRRQALLDQIQRLEDDERAAGAHA